MTITFKLPDQKALAAESVDSWCRELTDITGLTFAVWDIEGRFWMPVGFSTTLTGLFVGSDRLRELIHEEVRRTISDGESRQSELSSGLCCLTIPVRQRHSIAYVVSAVVLTRRDRTETLAAYLSNLAECSAEEVRSRLAGEHCLQDETMSSMARLIARFGAEHVKRLEAEEEIVQVGGKLSDGYEEITLYQRIASKIRISQPSEAFFLAMCSEMREFLDVEGLVALFHENVGEQTEPRVVTLGNVAAGEQQLRRFYHYFERDLMDGREAIISNECQDSDRLNEMVPGTRNMIIVPLRQGNKLYGIIAAFNRNNGAEFHSTDVKLVASVSGTIAVFVENSHLYENLHQLMLGTIKALVSSIDAKDKYTCGHSERVAWIAKRIAEQMGLPAEDVKRIYLTGLLHDIGKIGIPEKILLKNGRLEPEEYEVMKTHPTIGAKILAGVRELESVIPGVLHHHERIDGRGYPKGLDDENLSMEGRIIGLADSLDAMTSHRVYRAAMPMSRVEVEVRHCTGTQFDVRCVDALFEIGLAEMLDSMPAQDGGMQLEVGAGRLWRGKS
ncbi:MAG: HD domain-containing protein [Anaerolineaceae bacterium]|nr:HD domain-containing protein [Anaerolineaceae bacterium]